MPRKKKDQEQEEPKNLPEEGATFIDKGEEAMVDLNVQTSPNVEVPVTKEPTQTNVETAALMDEIRAEEDTDKVKDLENPVTINLTATR